MKNSWPDLGTFKICERIELVNSGEEYFNTLENLIDSAVHSIHIQVYILETDETGMRIIGALTRAVKRGVDVNVVVDSFGSNSLSTDFIKKVLTISGINFRRFGPVFSSRGIQIGRRLHHKIALSDNKRALIGGINIADKYHGTKTEKPWLDFAVLLEGYICYDVLEVCNDILKKKIFRKKIKTLSSPHIKNDFENRKLARLRQNDWLRKKNGISTSYKNGLKHSRDSVTIVGSYFLPGQRLRKLIRRATERGVEVRIILTQVSDVFWVNRATNFLYDFLHRHNVHIYEWTSSVVHGKLAVFDHEWATVGSYNLNFLSDYGSVELNVEIRDKAFIEKLDARLDEIISKGCVRVTPEDYKKNITFFGRFINWLAFYLVRLMMRLFFWFAKRNDHRNPF